MNFLTLSREALDRIAHHASTNQDAIEQLSTGDWLVVSIHDDEVRALVVASFEVAEAHLEAVLIQKQQELLRAAASVARKARANSWVALAGGSWYVAFQSEKFVIRHTATGLAESEPLTENELVNELVTYYPTRL